MKAKWIASSLLAFAVAITGATSAHALQGPPPPPPPGWDRVPGNYATDIERRAYHEGLQGARKDRGNGRPPNVNNREEYRHPDFPVPPRMYRAYRHAFRAGYMRGVQIFYNGRRY